MENVTKLRTELVEIFNHLKSDEMEIQKAKAMVAVSNSILKSAQLQLDHSKLTGDKNTIDFLKTDK